MNRAAIWIAALVLCIPVRSQQELNVSRFGGVVRIVNSDLAVLESHEERTDMGCDITTMEPQLGFDLRFHVAYRVAIPLKELAGSGDQLRVLIRVTQVDKPDNRLFLVDRFSVPPIEEDAKGEAEIPGGFTVGPGKYEVDWLMRDRRERLCSSHWEVEAKADDEEVKPALAPGTVAQRPRDFFREPPPVQRIAPADQLLHVKILVNFSPTDPRESTLKPWDVDAIVSILRSIAREPQIGRFSIVAFNMQEERVIYREDNVERIDFPALGQAVEAIQLGTVDFRRLQDPLSATRFLTSLLTGHVGGDQPELDAIVIVGPKLMLDKNVPQEALKSAGRGDAPIFYLNYNSNPRGNPWRDAIGAALKVYKGLEYTITLPRDLGSALTDMMFRVTQK